MTIQLLLVPADEKHPSNPPPLPANSLRGEPPPKPLVQPSHLSDLSAAPDSLPRQRWALVVPAGERGRRLQSLLEPLCQLRGQQQGASPDTYFAPPDLGEDLARKFKVDNIHPSSKPLREQARYLLLVGKPEEVSLELQHALMEDGSSFVGRLAFDRDDDYAAYVSKVLERERPTTSLHEARSLILSVQDGTPAIALGQEFLIEPMVKSLRSERSLGHLPASEILAEELHAGSSQRLRELAARAEPGVLFTLSHGLGAPTKGWARAEEQRRRQGNMSLGGGCELTPEDVRQGAFMPGGIWFYLACLGAGSPRASVYQPWLERLYRNKRMGGQVLDGLEKTRPVDGRPFMAALTQSALANPQGPLAIISHLDLAWTWGFHDAQTGQSHMQRFEGTIASLVRGHRVGVALNMLTRAAWQADSALRQHYEAVDGQRSGKVPTASDATLACWWMERHDLTHYLLLGDPAVRIPCDASS